MVLISVVSVITHSQWEAYMDLVENSSGGSGGGGRQEIEEPQEAVLFYILFWVINLKISLSIWF